jgi:hypothetical protein
MRTLLLALICSMLVLGCVSTRRQSGDFTEFLRQELVTRGAAVPVDAVLPSIRGTWTYGPTKFGDFHIFLRSKKLEEIDPLFTAALGQPQRTRDGQPGSKPLRIYSRRAVGVSLLIVGKENGVWIGLAHREPQ